MCKNIFTTSLSFLFSILLAWSSAGAQIAPAPGGAVDPDDERVNVFLDCPRCDETFIRREITFVDYVREPRLASVHILVTDEATGGGGRRYTLHLIGRRAFEGREYTMTFIVSSSATLDEERRAVTRALKVALVPYVLHTRVAARLSVHVDESPTTDEAPERDPWKGWTLEIYGDGFGDMEARQHSLHVRYGVFADRVTELWKIRIRPYFNYNLDQFEQEDETIRSTSRRDGLDSYIIRSINENWSIGLFADAFSSTFSNIDLRMRATPAVEYSVFPYREASRRQLTIAYRIGVGHVQYQDTTIFNRISELLPEHELDVEYEVTQPWGTIDLGVEASQYLSEPGKYRIEFDGGLNVRLARGLSLRAGGEVEMIHDQLNLARGDASLEEILLRRRQLATNFLVSGSVGFRYRFGSIYNNVVNTRF